MRGFSVMSLELFAAACDLAERAGSAPKDEHIRLASGALMLSLASLEAFLNEHLEMWSMLPAATPPLTAIVKALDRAPLETRWATLPYVLTGKTFPADAKPFQAFSHLVALRNAVVHYNPGGREHDAFPSKKIANLHNRFAFTDRVGGTWVGRVLNPACARWACRSAQAMIREYDAMRDRPDPWADHMANDVQTGLPVQMPTWWAIPPAEPPAA